MNQYAVPWISSFFHVHRGPTEPSTRLVVDARVSSVVVREHVPNGYVEVSETVSVHEGYVLDAVAEGVKVRSEGVWLFRRDELGRPFFHDDKGELVPVC